MSYSFSLRLDFLSSSFGGSAPFSEKAGRSFPPKLTDCQLIPTQTVPPHHDAIAARTVHTLHSQHLPALYCTLHYLATDPSTIHPLLLTMKSAISLASLVLLCVAVLIKPLEAFTIKPPQTVAASTAAHNLARSALPSRSHSTAVSKVTAVTADLDIVGLVAGQENYGFALVALCEAIWSFAQAPSFSHAIVLAPASIAAVILVAVSGPMVTSGDAGSVALGLEIATGVSTLLGAR